MSWVFANGPGDWGSIPGRVIPKTQKMVLDPALLNTQHYMVRIKGKVEQTRKIELRPPVHLGVVAMEKGAFGSPLTLVANFTYLYCFKLLFLFNNNHLIAHSYMVSNIPVQHQEFASNYAVLTK